MFIGCWKRTGFEGLTEYVIERIVRDSVISCKRERGIGSRGDELLVATRSVPMSDMEGTENTLSERVGIVGVIKVVYHVRLLRIFTKPIIIIIICIYIYINIEYLMVTLSYYIKELVGTRLMMQIKKYL